MSNKLKKALRRKKNEYEMALEPSNLNASAMKKETSLIALPLLPLVGVFAAIIAYGKYFARTQEDFTLVAMVGLVCWGVSMIGVYGAMQSKAAGYKLFKRTFMFTDRLHPTCEAYCHPEDIRVLIKKGDKIKDKETLNKELDRFGFESALREKVLERLGKESEYYFLYFKHKDAFEGWNQRDHTMPTFSSHIVISSKPYDQTYGFSSGQENWYGPVMYNHPSAELDAVEVVGWMRDPFTGEPMPVSFRRWGSLDFRKDQKELDKEEVSELEAITRLAAWLHGATEELKHRLLSEKEVSEAKLGVHKTNIEIGHEIAGVDQDYFAAMMKPTARHWWSSGWAKAIVTIFIVSAVIFLIAYLLHWIDLSKVFGG